MANYKLPYETRGTISGKLDPTDLAAVKLKEQKEKEKLEAKKQACLAKGWYWDEATQTCTQEMQFKDISSYSKIEPKEKPVTDEKSVKVSKPEISEFEGDPDKVTLEMPNGQVYVGIPKAEANRILSGYEEKQIQGEYAPLGTTQKTFEQQIRLQEAISKIGQPGGLKAAEEAAINWSQAATAGAAGIIPMAIGGATTGALIGGIAGGGVGSSVTAPAGAAIGAIGGVLTGFISGTLNNIKTQQRGELGAAKEELTAARTNMRQLAMMASRDPANADFYISLYNEQLTRVYQAERQTQLETQGDLNAWIEDGTKELAEFEVFLRPGGIADIYGQKLQVALQTNTPLSIVGDELFLDLENE